VNCCDGPAVDSDDGPDEGEGIGSVDPESPLEPSEGASFVEVQRYVRWLITYGLGLQGSSARDAWSSAMKITTGAPLTDA